MSESSDYTPGAWSGHDFGRARARYDHHVGRSYGDAQTKKVSATSLVPQSVKTNSPTPLIIWVDVTGSMGEWPATIFSKLPYLDHEMRTEYLGADAEVCFGAVGDATCDKFPVQIRPFTKGTDMAKELEGIVHERGGGCNLTESYELAALYTLHSIETPKAVEKPVVIFIGDEMPYDKITVAQAKGHAKVKIARQVTTNALFKSLKENFSPYLVLKSYHGGNSDVDRRIRKRWTELFGEDRIAHLSDPDRVVDVIFGILAKETGKEDYFNEELKGRQTKAQVKTVHKALDTIHQLEDDWNTLRPDPNKPKGGKRTPKKARGKSTLRKPPSGKKVGDLV